MSSNQPPPSFNNWVKCSESLIECGQVAAKVVKHISEEWHKTNIKSNEGDYKCRGEPECNPKLNNGIPNKPKAGRRYCQACIKWADDAIPELLAKCTVPGKPPYEAYWNLVKSKDLFENVVQVMKLFGLKSISNDTLAAIKEFDNFDSAWLLSMMEKVNLFHKGDVQSQVQRATDIRNKVMHWPVGREMTDNEMKDIFKVYTMLVKCFNKHFPSVVSDQDAEDLQARLDKIRDRTLVTSEMVQRTVTMFLTEVVTWKMEQGADIAMIQESIQGVLGICKSVPELRDQMVIAEKLLKDLAERVGKLEKKVESIEEQYNSIANQQEPRHQQSKDSGYSTSFSPTSPSDSTAFNPSATSPSDSSSTHTAGTSFDSMKDNTPIETEQREYDILMVHSEHDMDDKMYTDITNFFDKNDLSYVSMHELPAGVNVFKNFENMLGNCWWTMCLLSPQFLSDIWCDQRYVQACERAVRKQDESVFYVKVKGFNEDDIPAGLKGISGLDHGSKFFKSVLRSTFKKLREQREQNRGTQHKKFSSNQLPNGYQGEPPRDQDQPQTVVRGSGNILVNATGNSVINLTIQQLPSQTLGAGGESANSEPHVDSQMGQQKSSAPKLSTECTSLQSTTVNAIKCSEESTEKVVTSQPVHSNGDCNSASADATSHEEEPPPPYKDLVSLQDGVASVNLKDDDDTEKEPVSVGKKLPNKVAPLQLLKVQEEESIDSAGSLKKSSSSPDLLSIEKEDNKEESFGAPRSARLSSVSGETSAFPFSGYSKSFKPVYSKDESAQGTTGLKNLGNTCYMNTAIQCLSSASILSQYFMGEEYEGVRANTEGQVAEEFAKVVKALWLGKYKSISPTDLRNVVFEHLPALSGESKYRQHDVQEFLGSLIEDGLHKDVNLAAKKPKNSQNHPTLSDDERSKLCEEELSSIDWTSHMQSNQSIIVKLFQGQLRSTVECHGCEQRSSMFQVFTFLTLPIPADKADIQLSDCLEEFTKEEKLEGDNAYQCDKCKEKCSATKKMDIWRLPKILIVCLKRFTHKYVGGSAWLDKNRKMVKFPVTDLDVTDYTSRQRLAPSFDLFAVANHSGAIQYGHYTAYCQNVCNKKWYEYDDDIVKETTPELLQSAKAYLLFYSCLDMPPPT